ncbi:MAG: hypothetical protein P8J32_02870, partial [bacterium]|nr:hypothetical protein [bacterium]
MRTIETEDGSYLVQSGPRMFDDFYLYMTQEEYDAAICQYQDSTIEIVDMPFKPVTMFNDNVLVGLWLVSDSTMFGNESNDFEEKINSMVSVAYGVDAPDEYTFDWSRFH